MGIRTGKPRGRPRGAQNKITVERVAKIEKAAQAIAEALPDSFEGDAHTLLMLVYKDKIQPWPIRIDAAKAAIAFEKHKLAAVQHSGDPDNPIEQNSRVELVVVDPSEANHPGYGPPQVGTFNKARPI